MSTNPNNTSEGRSPAIDQAEQGADAWQAAATAQRQATPDHMAFYAIAAEIVATLRHLDEVTDVLTRQVADYGHTIAARGGVLRDDRPGHDPAERVAIASSWVAQTRHLIGQAERAANRFWSEVGHIAVDTADPAGDTADPAGDVAGPVEGEVSR